MASHEIPKECPSLSPGFQRLISDLLNDARIRYEFEADPRRVASRFELTPDEETVVTSRDQVRWAKLLHTVGFQEGVTSNSSNSGGRVGARAVLPRWRRRLQAT